MKKVLIDSYLKSLHSNESMFPMDSFHTSNRPLQIGKKSKKKKKTLTILKSN